MATKTSKDIRNESRFMVLRAVYSGGTVSRAQVAAETGLSPATVNTLVGELVHELPGSKLTRFNRSLQHRLVGATVAAR